MSAPTDVGGYLWAVKGVDGCMRGDDVSNAVERVPTWL